MTEESTTAEAWREVGEQFEALGESLAQAFRAAWEDEENRQQLRELRDGLEKMAGEVSQAIQEAAESPQGQKVQQEVGKAAQSVRAAGSQTWQETRPHLASALRQMDTELKKLIDRLEQEMEE